MIHSLHLTGGTSHTVWAGWNVATTAFFKEPQGAVIRVKYGKGRWSSRNAQEQRLDGHTIMALRVGKGSLVYARMRVKLPVDGDITFEVLPGNVAQASPEFEF